MAHAPKTSLEQVDGARTGELPLASLQARLFLNGDWLPIHTSASRPIINPATGETIGAYAVAGAAEIERAISGSVAAFPGWRATAATLKSKMILDAAALLFERREHIARLLTAEQGKTLREARNEVTRAAEIIEWYGQEARRIYGRILPSSGGAAILAVHKEPIGPVAAFTPWNFPLSQAARKLGAAVAAGCTVVLKGAEDTPLSCVELVRAFADAGIPAGVVSLLFGNPQEISDALIPHPGIRKISFTGSVEVGRKLAAAAGQHLKYATMELGGHAPVLVFGDADIPQTAASLAEGKFRNAGQVCVSPTRILVERSVFDAFLDAFRERVSRIKIGDGAEDATDMGPLVHERRPAVMEGFVEDAQKMGAQLVLGGCRVVRPGFFFQPTILAHVPMSARIMNEEPFGPIAIVNAFDDEAAAVAEANRLPYGLAAYVFTTSNLRIRRLSAAIAAGMISVNGQPLGLPEAPFGGIKDSGFGREGGVEGIEEYLTTKLVSERAW